MQVRGRHLVFAWTAVFIVAVGAIVLRTRSGFRVRGHVNELENQIKLLESVKADVEASVAKLMSRRVLAPKVAAFGLRHPSDTAVVIIRVPARR